MVIFILIGIIDSGLGGISVFNHLVRMHKYNHYILFLDYKYNPFGLKDEQVLYKRLLKTIAFLKKKNCQNIIIACNTLSLVALKYNVKDVITPLLCFKNELLTNYDASSILLATNYTIKSNYYLVNGRYSSDLVSYIEGNKPLNINLIVDELFKYKKIFFGCTHFYLLKNKFKNKEFFDSGLALANNYINNNDNKLKLEIYVSKVNSNIYNHLLSHIHLSRYNIFLINI